MSDIQTLKPGILVSLNTSTKGNRSYRTLQLDATHIDDRGEERSRWETTKVVADPVEYEAALKVRNRARTLVSGVCAGSAFGLLCPEDRLPELQAAVAEARELTAEFNTGAALTHISVNVIYGRIAADDVEAIRAISSELSELMETMQTGLAALDVAAVRAACNKARDVGQMLSVDAKRQVDDAVQAARLSCRKIVKAGESAAAEIDAQVLAKISSARTAFLDLSEAGEITAPTVDVAAVDMLPGYDYAQDEPGRDDDAAPDDSNDWTESQLAAAWTPPAAPAPTTVTAVPAFDWEV